MLTFDASSVVYAWDNYPIDQIQTIWTWLGNEVSQTNVQMSQRAFHEVEKVTPECAKWLQDHRITKIPVSDHILQLSLAIKHTLGIAGDTYGAGVGENDIIIIATAQANGVELVTNESWQNNPPHNMAKYKISRVCHLPSVGVSDPPCFFRPVLA